MKHLAVCGSITSIADRMERSLLIGVVVCVPPSVTAAAVLARDDLLVRRQLRLEAVLCLS